MTIVALDVYYNDEADTAKVGVGHFVHWVDVKLTEAHSVTVSGVMPYVSGRFFERELPCLLAGINSLDQEPDIIVVDSFVHLDAGKKGLGAHLFDALGGRVPVIGVAKTAYQGISSDCEILRGSSTKALYVTAAGIHLDEAKAYIKSMAGEHRMPTLLTAVDHLSRGLD